MQNKTRLIIILLLIIAAGVILIAVLPARKIAAPKPLDPFQFIGQEYPAFTWGAPEATTTAIYENGTSTLLIGSVAQTAPVSNVNDPASVSEPFIKYYDTQLTRTGWIEDKNLDADGPASSSRTYRKGSEIVIISYQSDLKNQQQGNPSACPCDMTFSVFEGM